MAIFTMPVLAKYTAMHSYLVLLSLTSLVRASLTSLVRNHSEPDLF